MPQYPTKVLANTGANSPSSGGNSGVTGKYYKYSYFVSGLPAAVTAIPLGTLPCKCHYVGCSASLGTSSVGTTTITIAPKIVPYDTGVAASLNSTELLLGTPVTCPVFTTTINFDAVGTVSTSGSNLGTSVTGITLPVLKTGTSAQGRQGDAVALTTSGTFTSAAGLAVDIWFQEDNGNN